MESHASSPGSVAPSPPPQHRGPDPKRSVVLAVTGVTITALLGALVSARLGALAVAATLVVAGIWRALAPRTSSAAGIVVRSKTLDVCLCLATAIGIAVLALTVPYLG